MSCSLSYPIAKCSNPAGSGWGEIVARRLSKKTAAPFTSLARRRAEDVLPRYLFLQQALAELALETDPDRILDLAVERLKAVYPGDDATVFVQAGPRLRLWRHAPGTSTTTVTTTVLDVHGPGVVAEVARTGRPLRLGDVRADRRYLKGLEGMRVRSELAVPLTAAGRVLGVLNLESQRPRRFSRLDEQVVATAGLHLAALLDSARTRQRLRKAMLDTVTALSAMVEAKDGYTEGHCQRIAEIAIALGIRLGLSEERLEQLSYAAVLHDIGKITVPDEILNKPGPLTPEEFEVMKSHTRAGRRILEGIELLRAVARIVEQHHERWDGRGYPDGLAGEAILLEARLIAVADAYDAMTSTRPYRQALPPAEALARVEAEAGRQFDPDVVAAFVRYIKGG
jgi:putative nucleotidyltransferase with HDIG domain